MRGPREVVEKFSEPDSEGMVLRACCSPLRGCSVDIEEILVLVNTGKQSENSGPLASGSLCCHSSASRMVRTWCPSRSR